MVADFCLDVSNIAWTHYTDCRLSYHIILYNNLLLLKLPNKTFQTTSIKRTNSYHYCDSVGVCLIEDIRLLKSKSYMVDVTRAAESNFLSSKFADGTSLGARRGVRVVIWLMTETRGFLHNSTSRVPCMKFKKVTNNLIYYKMWNMFKF